MFEFNPTLIMEDDEDAEGEVFVHHHDKVRGWGYHSCSVYIVIIYFVTIVTGEHPIVNELAKPCKYDLWFGTESLC